MRRVVLLEIKNSQYEMPQIELVLKNRPTMLLAVALKIILFNPKRIGCCWFFYVGQGQGNF